MLAFQAVTLPTTEQIVGYNKGKRKKMEFIMTNENDSLQTKHN